MVYCSSYFSTTAPEEILHQIRPKLSPLDNSAFDDAQHILDLFLPANMPRHLHSQGFRFVHSKQTRYVSEPPKNVAKIFKSIQMGPKSQKRIKKSTKPFQVLPVYRRKNLLLRNLF